MRMRPDMKYELARLCLAEAQATPDDDVANWMLELSRWWSRSAAKQIEAMRQPTKKRG